MIAIEQVRKSYDGRRGLDGFSLNVEEGEILGLVGPNGAGKTTLIKILSTLLVPDGGRASVAGFDVTVHPREVKRLAGYMPDQPGLYQDMRVREFLEFFADAFQLGRERRRIAVDRELDRSGLTKDSDVFVEELSFGMKQRLILARTLLHDPKVLLLDEPATGLDPMARIELRRQLTELNARGITILISSHILADLEDICGRVAMVSEGKNATDSEGHSLIINLQKATLPRMVYEVEVIREGDRAADLAREMPGVQLLEQYPTRMVLVIEGEAAHASQLLRHLVTGGIEVVGFAQRGVTLEDRYQQAFGGKPR
jgi:ABC-2 type transport system ATP-binding protein